MKEKKRITLFMLVTNRDCIIADYAIKSYNKIFKVKTKFGFEDFTLFIYLNCLSPENKAYYLERWKQYPYTILFDNIVKINDFNNPYPGQKIISPEGITRSRDDYAENYDELWTTELGKFETPYIATVDADFEVLNADFYFYLLRLLDENREYIGASASYSDTAYKFDTYSKRDIVLFERNHTWFCIYKKEAFNISKISHFYYEELNNEGNVVAYDSAAYFQNDLKKNHSLTFATLPDEFKSSFVHYGATSKNKSLTRKNIWFYRLAFMLSATGLIYGRENNPIIHFINKVVRKIATLLFGRYLNRINIERSTYIYDENS